MAPRRTPQTLAIIQAIREGHSHGYAIQHATGLKSGTVYPTLRRLEEAGWLTSHPEPDEDPYKPARRVYKLTDQAPD